MEVQPDGLPHSEAGAWTEEKHSLVSYYARLFSTGMKDKWHERIYIELYAGPGHSKIRGTSKVIAGSPLQALALPDQFDKYVFCEEDSSHLDALKARVTRDFPSANVAYIRGDCNQNVEAVLEEITHGTKDHRVLSLCFVDPFDIGIRFRTIEGISARFVDFVVLLALHMDANRNYERYVREDASKVDDFLGSETWRNRWRIAERNVVPFPKFLAEEFAASMEGLGYLPTPIHRMKLVRSAEKNLPLYYIALFSRHRRAHEFWDEVLKYGTDQTEFPWGNLVS